jgi:hypothetical protein
VNTGQIEIDRAEVRTWIDSGVDHTNGIFGTAVPAKI